MAMDSVRTQPPPRTSPRSLQVGPLAEHRQAGRGLSAGSVTDNDRNKRGPWTLDITHHGVRDENLAVVDVVILLDFLSRDGLKSDLHHGDRLSVFLSLLQQR